MPSGFDDVDMFEIGGGLDDKAPVESLRYMGPTSKTQLNAIGIKTIGDLKCTGVIDTYLAVQATGYPVNLNFAWAMYAGLMGVEFGNIPTDFKQAVRTEMAGTHHSG